MPGVPHPTVVKPLAMYCTRCLRFIRRLTSQGSAAVMLCQAFMRVRASAHVVWMAVTLAGTVQLGVGASTTERRRLLKALTQVRVRVLKKGFEAGQLIFAKPRFAHWPSSAVTFTLPVTITMAMMSAMMANRLESACSQNGRLLRRFSTGTKIEGGG